MILTYSLILMVFFKMEQSFEDTLKPLKYRNIGLSRGRSVATVFMRSIDLLIWNHRSGIRKQRTRNQGKIFYGFFEWVSWACDPIIIPNILVCGMETPKGDELPTAMVYKSTDAEKHEKHGPNTHPQFPKCIPPNNPNSVLAAQSPTWTNERKRNINR